MTPQTAYARKRSREIRRRCRRVNGCLLWSGGIKAGAPVVTVASGTRVNVRRLLWELSRGEALHAGVVLNSCAHHRRCVEPRHQRATTRAEHNWRASKRFWETKRNAA